MAIGIEVPLLRAWVDVAISQHLQKRIKDTPYQISIHFSPGHYRKALYLPLMHMPKSIYGRKLPRTQYAFHEGRSTKHA